MNLLVTSRLLGLLLLVLSLMILLVAGFSAAQLLLDGSSANPEREALPALLWAAVGGGVLGLILLLVGRFGAGRFGQREALLRVAMGWIVGAGLCGAPFRVWATLRCDAEIAVHDFDSSINCYFEAMSGLTTTGATILQSIGTVPRSLLLWRATTHWLGGLGIVVLFVAVLPLLGIGGRRLYRIESPGPSPEGVTPRIQDAARVLWMIYLGLTVAEILSLKLCGMTWFDSICHTFATLATGGFSTLDSSIAGFQSSVIHVVIIVFMVLAGVNFSLYHALWQRRWRMVLRNSELRVYLGIMVLATVIITASLLHSTPDAGAIEGEPSSTAIVLRDAAFQAVSVQTTTGFCTANFDQWGAVARITLIFVMFIGASAGSTGGGIKVIRIIVAAKVMLAEVERAFRPKVVRSIKVGGEPIDPDMKVGCLAYILGIIVLFALGAGLLLMIEGPNGIDLTTAMSASAATINNIGPGLGAVGSTHNYAWFTAEAKVVLSGLMLLGRLEIFAVIVLFSPHFWQHE